MLWDQSLLLLPEQLGFLAMTKLLRRMEKYIIKLELVVIMMKLLGIFNG